jgi:hypothetical protein
MAEKGGDFPGMVGIVGGDGEIVAREKETLAAADRGKGG